MGRVQLALNVDDIDEAVTFYSKLFSTEPAKRRPGYANFAITEPPLKLVLMESPGQGGSLNHLGVEVADVDTVDATQTRLAEEGLELAREVADTWSIALGTGTLGLLALEAGDREQARSHLATALELSWRRDDERIVAESLFSLAAVAAAGRDPAAAARRWGAAEALRQSLGAIPSPTENALEKRFLAELRMSMGTAGLQAEREAGAALPLEQVVDLALES